MKKVLAIILSALMLFSVMSIGVMAEEEEKVPVVILQGYSGPNLAYADENGEPIVENGEVKLAWPLNFDDIGTKIMGLIADVTLNQKELGEAIVDVLQEYFAPLEMNPDGTSKNNLVPYPSGAAATRASTLIENGMEEYIPEEVVAQMAIEEVGAENVFGFTQDWRQSQVDSAADLDAYIQEVKEITGSEQVDIYGLSHGGQYGTSYLYYYGYKGDVRRAMFGDPATLGTSAVGSFFTGEYVDVNLEDVIEFVEHGFEYEKDWEWLLQLLTLDEFLVEIVNSALVNTDLLEGIVLIPSLWDFVPHNYFEEALRYVGLNAEENGSLYADTVKYHTDISNGGLNLANTLSDLKVSGMRIGYVVGSGYDSINGKYNSDILIDTYLSSGSTCMPLGETFPEGYEKAGTVCSNPNHYHISPDFDIDASTGFMPDNTWYVRNQGHGMIMHDPYTKNLVHDFLWGDIENVFSSKAYPQFNLSQNPGEVLYARFDNTSTGYHSTVDTALEITNLSAESNIQIWAIEAVGADIDFDFDAGMTVVQGKTATIEATNNDFASAETPFAVNVRYSIMNTQLTYVDEVINFTPLTNAQVHKYEYLIDDGVALPSEDDEPTTDAPTTDDSTTDEPSADAPSTDAPSTDGTNGGTSDDVNTENVTGDIPNTNRAPKSAAPIIAAASLVGIAGISAGAVIKRKREE